MEGLLQPVKPSLHTYAEDWTRATAWFESIRLFRVRFAERYLESSGLLVRCAIAVSAGLTPIAVGIKTAGHALEKGYFIYSRPYPGAC